MTIKIITFFIKIIINKIFCRLNKVIKKTFIAIITISKTQCKRYSTESLVMIIDFNKIIIT